MGEGEKKQTPTLILDPRDVFRMVLKRPSFDVTPPRTPSTDAPSSASSKTSPANEMPVPGHGKFEGFLHGLRRVGAVGEAEADVLVDVQNQEPINKNFKSQLSRANKSLKAKAKEEEAEVNADSQKKSQKGGSGNKTTKKPPNKKAKKIKKTVLKEKKNSKETPPHVDTAQDTNEDEHTTDVMEEDGTKGQAASSKDKKKISKTKKMKCKAKKMQPKKEIPMGPDHQQTSLPRHLPEGADPNKTRVENRKLLTSRAYHKAADAHWAQRPKGHVPEEYWEECKVKARQAGAQAGADFDQVWPRSVNVD